MRKTASNYYLNGFGNCAQAVAAAWSNATGSYREKIAELALCGHGRAPGGLCGALHAARCLLDIEQADSLTSSFAAQSGGRLACREIRSAKALKCYECVELAAGLLEQHVPQG